MKTLRLVAGAIAIGFAGSSHGGMAEVVEYPDTQFSSADASIMSAKARDLGSPVAIYEYVRNNFEFTLYQGLRSGSVNTFYGQRGNDVDQASTLIAMLRSRNVPARYVTSTVQITANEALAWLDVENIDLAKTLLIKQGFPDVVLSTDKSTLQFEHVWVEALVAQDEYRGATVRDCTVANSFCQWVALTPAFKLRAPATRMDVFGKVLFDYTKYYSSIKNYRSKTAAGQALDVYEKQKDANPLTIYEDLIRQYLASTPGKTLDDVAGVRPIIKSELGYLPSSLPFKVAGAIRRYNSASEHDAVVGTSETQTWIKQLTITLYTQQKINGAAQFDKTDQPIVDQFVINKLKIPLYDLVRKRLTLTFKATDGKPCSASCQAVLRLDNIEQSLPLATVLTVNDPLVLDLALDSADPLLPVAARYYSLNAVGGYYLIGTGGDSSNWAQVHRAADQLLSAQADWVGAGQPDLSTSPQNNDALTGGLLYTAMNQYFARFRESSERLGYLNHVRCPIDGFLGVVSATNQVETVSGIAYRVLPGGLLIDMKGQRFSGCYRTDSATSGVDRHFELLGHAMSSLEHETWQALTGYDAVSTVRGIQMAVDQGAQLVNPKRFSTTNNVATEMNKFGYGQVVTEMESFGNPDLYYIAGSGYKVFGYSMLSKYNFKRLHDQIGLDFDDQSFEMMRKSVTSTMSTLQKSRITYSYPTSSILGIPWGFTSIHDQLACYRYWSRATYENKDYRDPNIPSAFPGMGDPKVFSSGTNNGWRISNFTGCAGVTYYGSFPIWDLRDDQSSTSAVSVFGIMRKEFRDYFLSDPSTAVARSFFSASTTFTPSEWFYRSRINSQNYLPAGIVLAIRDQFSLTSASAEYIIPSKLTLTPNNKFTVYLYKSLNSAGNITGQSFAIQNWGYNPWGGGYIGLPDQEYGGTEAQVLGASSVEPTSVR